MQKLFLEINDFPLWNIKQVFAGEQQKNKYHYIEDNDGSVRNAESGNKCPLLVLPYQVVQVSSLAES